MRLSRALTALIIITCATGAIAGCGSQGKSLDANLVEADKRCDAVHWQFLGGWTQCLHGEERRVWQRVDPDTLPIFEEIAQRRDELAAQFDQGKLGAEGFKVQLNEAKAEFRAKMAAYQGDKAEQEASTRADRAALVSGIFTVIGAVLTVAIEAASAYGEARYGAKAFSIEPAQPRQIPAPNFEIDHTTCQLVVLPGFPRQYQCTTTHY